MSQNLFFESVGEMVEQSFRDKVATIRVLCIQTVFTADKLKFKAGSFYTFTRTMEGYAAQPENTMDFSITMYKDNLLQKEDYKKSLDLHFKKVSENDLLKIRFIYPHHIKTIVRDRISSKYLSDGYEQKFLSSLQVFSRLETETLVTEVFWELPVYDLRFIDDLLSPLYKGEDWKWYELDIDFADYELYGK